MPRRYLARTPQFRPDAHWQRLTQPAGAAHAHTHRPLDRSTAGGDFADGETVTAAAVTLAKRRRTPQERGWRLQNYAVGFLSDIARFKRAAHAAIPDISARLMRWPIGGGYAMAPRAWAKCPLRHLPELLGTPSGRFEYPRDSGARRSAYARRRIEALPPKLRQDFYALVFLTPNSANIMGQLVCRRILPRDRFSRIQGSGQDCSFYLQRLTTLHTPIAGACSAIPMLLDGEISLTSSRQC